MHVTKLATHRARCCDDRHRFRTFAPGGADADVWRVIHGWPTSRTWWAPHNEARALRTRSRRDNRHNDQPGLLYLAMAAIPSRIGIVSPRSMTLTCASGNSAVRRKLSISRSGSHIKLVSRDLGTKPYRNRIVGHCQDHPSSASQRVRKGWCLVPRIAHLAQDWSVLVLCLVAAAISALDLVDNYASKMLLGNVGCAAIPVPAAELAFACWWQVRVSVVVSSGRSPGLALAADSRALS